MLFRSVTVTGSLDIASCTDPKSTLAGDSDDSDAGRAVPASATLRRPAGVLSQKLSRPLRRPVAVGLKRTSTVQLWPFPSGTDSEHVPPTTTPKSLGFTLEDAMPNRDNDKLPAPAFVSVTVTGSLDIASCTDPKSTLAGAADEAGRPGAIRVDPIANAGGTPVAPAQAKAATAKSAATSLRIWWGQTVGVANERSSAYGSQAPPVRVVRRISGEGFSTRRTYCRAHRAIAGPVLSGLAPG